MMLAEHGDSFDILNLYHNEGETFILKLKLIYQDAPLCTLTKLLLGIIMVI